MSCGKAKSVIIQRGLFHLVIWGTRKCSKAYSALSVDVLWSVLKLIPLCHLKSNEAFQGLFSLVSWCALKCCKAYTHLMSSEVFHGRYHFVIEELWNVSKPVPPWHLITSEVFQGLFHLVIDELWKVFQDLCHSLIWRALTCSKACLCAEVFNNVFYLVIWQALRHLTSP